MRVVVVSVKGVVFEEICPVNEVVAPFRDFVKVSRLAERRCRVAGLDAQDVPMEVSEIH